MTMTTRRPHGTISSAPFSRSTCSESTNSCASRSSTQLTTTWIRETFIADSESWRDYWCGPTWWSRNRRRRPGDGRFLGRNVSAFLAADADLTTQLNGVARLLSGVHAAGGGIGTRDALRDRRLRQAAGVGDVFDREDLGRELCCNVGAATAQKNSWGRGSSAKR